MSTYWYLECADHTPPLRSVDEVEQHTRGLDVVRELCAHRDTLMPGFLPDNYLERNATMFLIQHPKCNLRLVNEYGDYETVD